MDQKEKSFFGSFLFSSLKGKILFALSAGIVSCLLSLSIFFVPGLGLALSNFSLLPIFLSGFALGTWGAGLSSFVVCLVGGLGGNFFISLLTFSFVVFLVHQSLQVREVKGVRFFYPEGRFLVFLLLVAILFLGVLVFSIKVFLLESLSAMWHENFVSFESVMLFYVHQLTKGIALETPLNPEIFSFVAHYGIAFFLCSWIVSLFINAEIALIILKESSHGLRPPFKMRDIVLPPWYPLLLLGSVALILMPGDFSYLGKNAAIVIILGFIFQGCSLVHAFLQKRFEKENNLRKLMFVFFYGSMVVLPWFLGVAGLGILDHFMHLKKRVLA